MSIIEAIRKRRSVRSYSGDQLSDDIKEKIIQYINGLEAPFGAKVRIKLISKQGSGNGEKLGTYGVIKGAANFLVLAYEESDMAEYAVGYVFEQVVLYCTELGLGTCWIGGTFKHKDFAEQIWIKPNEKLRIISPLGYGLGKSRLLESIMRGMVKSDKRKPFETIFFSMNFSSPLREIDAGKFLKPLQMLRLSPSASNTQPWRVVKEYDCFHFYYNASASRFSAIDMGIALCHFEQTCIEIGLPGCLTVKSEMISERIEKGCCYAMSWVSKPVN